jgi:serine/threonine-protein kinase
MMSDPPAGYEELTPEEAAQIDAVCDRFERAWKEARAGGPAPRIAAYLGGGQGPAPEALLRELVALDEAYRERYGVAARPDDSEGPGTAEAASTPPTRPLRGPNVPAGRPADWPCIPGLEFVDFLGAGGMGVVYKARQATLDRYVAVKFLLDDRRADSGRRERFLQEARAVARLRHPHLVQVYQFGEAPVPDGAAPRPYLVLEYVAGGSLAELARGSPQPPREAARLVETLADAIHYAHQQGVVHRDLKPANVLLQRAEVPGDGSAEAERGPRASPPRPLTADVCPKITDFGLAKFLAGSDLTHSGDVLGTPCYMAPEQAAGTAEPVTAAVDVYGLGAILFETLTGRPPFSAATAAATLGLVRQGEPVPPRRLQPTVPHDLETICLKCLRKEPGRRYASAQDLADDLRRFRAGEPVKARPVGTGERVVVWCRRNPVVAGLLAALVLVFLTGAAGVLWQWQQANQNAADADRNAAAYRHERDIAREEKARAERRLKLVHSGVDRLTHLGRDLRLKPGQYRAGQAILKEALAFYQDLLPEDADDPAVRREAAQLYRLAATIHSTLGQADKAAEAYVHEADLLTALLKDEPGNRTFRLDLADCHRARGNALRDLGKTGEAREAYRLAAEIHQELLCEFPDNAGYKVALANTLLNRATLLSTSDQAEKVESLYSRVLDLDRAAVRDEPNNARFKSELALALGDQALLYLDTARLRDAEDAAREALKFDQQVLAAGRMKGEIERYTSRHFIRLGQVLAAAGQARDAEAALRNAVSLVEPLVKDFPESATHRTALALARAALADFLDEQRRRPEAEEVRRDVVRCYESLQADFPEEPMYQAGLAQNYLRLAGVLWELGRPGDADEPYRKALAVDPEDPAVNNEAAWFLATNPEPCLRDPGLAVRRARKAVAARPQSADCQNTLGVALYRAGDDKAAVAELEAAMRLRVGGGNSFDWFFLAMAHWRLGDRDQARRWFDRAVRWMDSHKPYDDELRRFRAEAEVLVADDSKR